jgi:hypothetical protein
MAGPYPVRIEQVSDALCRGFEIALQLLAELGGLKLLGEALEPFFEVVGVPGRPLLGRATALAAAFSSSFQTIGLEVIAPPFCAV